MGQILNEPIIEKDSVGGTDKEKKLQFGCSCMQGYRISMEDQHTNETDHYLFNSEKKLPKFNFFAIFDGHSGSKASYFSSKNLLKCIKSQEEANYTEKIKENPKYQIFSDDESIIKSYLKNDEDFNEECQKSTDNSGTTCISTIVVEKDSNKYEIICGNVGDSRSILYNQGKVIAMSMDHKPTLENETQRIQNAGGFVEFARVNGTLALSRAFGDFGYKKNNKLGVREQIVVAVPDIKRENIELTKKDNDYTFLVLACDGIWDVFKNEDVAKFVKIRLEQQRNGTYYEDRLKYLKPLYDKRREEEGPWPLPKNHKKKGYDLNAICEDLIDASVLEFESKDNVSASIILFENGYSQL